MSSRPTKRARVSKETESKDDYESEYLPNPTPAIHKHNSDLVQALDSRTIAKILIDLADHYPDISQTIETEVKRAAEVERNRVVDFDYLSKSAWKTLNVTYERMKDSHAYQMSGEAGASIERCFETIQIECPQSASFKTKANALETLRKIGKSICLSTGVIPKEIRNDPGTTDMLVATMLEIVESLLENEKISLSAWCDDKLVELQRLGSEYCIFENLDEVIDYFAHDDEEESSDVEDDVEDDSSN